MKLRALKVLIALCTSIVVNAQNPWTETMILRFGYGVENWKVEDVYNGFRYEQVRNEQSQAASISIAQNNTFTYPKFPMEVEWINESFYFYTNANAAPDLIRDASVGYEKTGDSESLEAKRFSYIPFKLDFGGWIKDKVGIFGGLQWQYSRVEIKDPSVPDMMFIGGNRRGVNVIGFYGTESLLLKASFDYDWVRHSKRAAKGNAQTFNIEATYDFGGIGVFAGYSITSMINEGLQGTPTEDWEPDGVQNQGVENYTYNFPDQKTTIGYFRFGLAIAVGKE